MRTLTVTGHGSASAVPDSAVVRVAAVQRGSSLTEALEGAESARARVVAVAAEHSVATRDLAIWPVHDDQGRPAGFEARHALAVSTTTVEQAGDLLAALAAEVGDRLVVEGVDLVVADPTAALGRAREAAYADATARAEHLASLAGAVLDRVQSIGEGAVPVGPPGGPVLAAAKADVGLQPGESTFTAALTVTWSLAD
ncbi:SIMPL domain-containing protein [Nocardioides flavescens]|uniref:DUF541 domain-containing protein n=1 Tax=Nocardioides flavescens TaxID=2691959 RepID=A0A6L7ETK6_9ACTN|nr:DUF541 domain-containing protein [Nocardioides flavescens]